MMCGLRPEDATEHLTALTQTALDQCLYHDRAAELFLRWMRGPKIEDAAAEVIADGP